MPDVVAALTVPAASAGDAWSGTDLALRFGAPVVVLLVGVMVFLWGRTLRSEVLGEASRGGFGGPPGSSDVGSADGFGVEEGRAQLRRAQQRVLGGLLLMLVGSLGFLAVIAWKVLS